VFFGLIPIAAPTSGLETKDRQESNLSETLEQIKIIMTADELHLFNSLSSDEDIRRFLANFWKTRNPGHAGSESAARDEFFKRVHYANLWFSTNHPHPGRIPPKNRILNGWNSDRGRIYLVLGPPDLITKRLGPGAADIDYTNRRSITDRTDNVVGETWSYNLFNIDLFFGKIGNVFILKSYSNQIHETLEKAKMQLITDAYFRSELKNRLSFTAKYKKNKLVIKIPLQNIILDEAAKCHFEIMADIYKNGAKIDKIIKTLELPLSDIDLKKKSITLNIPCIIKDKGNYSFDLVVKDLLAVKFNKHRLIIRTRI